MSPHLEYPETIDKLFGWHPGTAARMARRRRLPHYRLPDDSIRLCLEEVTALVRRVPAVDREPRPRMPRAGKAVAC